MAPTLQLVVPTSDLHGGVRLPMEISDWMAHRGWETRVIGSGPPPDWHNLKSPWVSVDVAAGEPVPSADVTVATFYSTVPPSLASQSGRVLHLCQGYEGQFLEYSDIRSAIDEAYRAPIPKLLVSDHLEPLLEGLFPGCRFHVVGEAVDPQLFLPGEFRWETPTIRIGVVGSFSSRIKGLRVGLEGLRMAREGGLNLEVHRASVEPMAEEEKAFGLPTVFHHRLPTGKMPGFYSGIDALLFPSIGEEGFGLPVIEAMSCGVPVIHSDIPSLQIIPADASLKFMPENAPEIADRLFLLQDHRERTRLREQGLVTATKFHPDILLDNLEEALRCEGIDREGRLS
ncbi:MAG: glycosyltransferase [Thermoanaerobaculales bacterium]|nr:glycosyltransferase [Thermoanaerobaculales bacterium]